MPKLISLYTGAGGLDYGFAAAGFETAAAVEVDHDCCETLRTNRKWQVIERDILAVPTAEILEVSGRRAGDVELLIGGPPCQPFSKAGYWARGDSKRLLDPRASTLHAYMRVVKEALPRAFVLENVPGLAFSGKDEGLLLLLEMIQQINKETGSNYVPHTRQLNAADYGVPQVRQRVFVVASRDGLPFEFPKATHVPRQDVDGTILLSPHVELHRTAWDALADLPTDAHPTLRMTGKWADLLPSIPEGENYLYHTDRGPGLALFGWRRRYWTFLLKLAKNRPSWTIQAQPGPSTGPLHWDNRYLSMRELCRLQTFPDDVHVQGSRRVVQMQIGNAVPSLLAEVLGRSVRAQLLEEAAPDSHLSLLPPVRSPCPPPRAPSTVPRSYHHLIGEYEAHPGTGKGYRASSSA